MSTKDKVSDATLILLCALIVVFLTPIVARNIPNGILLAIMALFVVSVLLRILYLPKYELATLVLLAAYMVIQTLYKLSGKSTAELYYYFNTVQFFFFFGAVMAVYAALSESQMKILIWVSVGIMVVTMLDNVLLLWEHGPTNYVTLYQWAKYTTNSTNTQFAFAVLLLAGETFIYGMYEKRTLCRNLSFVLTAFCLYYVVAVAQRTIVIVLAVLMFPLLVLANLKTLPGKNLSRKAKIRLLAVGLAAILLVCVFYKPILLGIGKLTGSARIAKRINQVILLLETGSFQEAGGSLAARYNLIMTSWNTFTSSFSSFMFGVGDHRSTNDVIGNHSQIVDEMARYGIVGTAVVFWLFARIFRVMKKMSSVRPGTRASRFLNVFLFVFALRALVGSVFDVSIAIQLFVLIPLLLKLISTGDQVSGNKAVRKRRNRKEGEKGMIISTCSFGSSGSSAVSDYLCECEGVQVMDALEFPITNSVDGLQDLEIHLMHKNPRQGVSIYALQRFKKLVMEMAIGWHKRTGVPVERVNEIVDEFIENISQVKYVGFSPKIDKKHSELLRVYLGESLIRRRIVGRLERKGIIKENIDFYPLETVHISIHPENFYEEARKFVRTILTEMGADFSKKIVLDQALGGSDPARGMPFFDDAYAIVVDRDPRDMYIFAKKVLLSRGRFMPTDTVENFIEYYRLLRCGDTYRQKHDKIMWVRFEDMIYNYDETTAKIDQFLNVKNVRPKTVFKPEMSAANTNLIRKFPEFAEDIKKIEEALPEFLFDFENYQTIDDGGKMFFGKSPLNKK